MIELFNKQLEMTKGITNAKPLKHYFLMIGLIMFAEGTVQFLVMTIFNISLESSTMTLVSLYLTLIGSLLIIWTSLKDEKRTLSSLGLTPKGIKPYILGHVVGFVMLSGALFITMCLHGTEYLGVNLKNPILLVLYFIGFLFQGFEEEVMCRGYMMNGLSKSKSIFFSVMTNSLFFGALHLGNPGINVLSFVNLVLAGISFSCMAVYFDNIWVASGAHSMWNFAQGNIYGILVSGMSMGPTIFRFELIGNSIISGGQFGLEGGIGVFIIEIISIIFFILLAQKKKAD